MSAPEEIDVTVESLGGLGDGIASHRGKPLFIPKSCMGDRLRVRIVRENAERLQGDILEVLAHGSDRQAAPCAYFGRCGGCALQQLTDESYRTFKRRMLHGSLKQGGFPDIEANVTFVPSSSRRRADFKIARDGKKLRLAFYEQRSHTAVAVDNCLVLKPELQALIKPLAETLGAAEFAEALEGVSLTAADTGIDMVLTVKGRHPSKLKGLEAIADKLGLARISAGAPDGRPAALVERVPVQMQLGPYAVALPPDAFLQATAEGQNLLARVAQKATNGAGSVIDLFSGIGTYSFPISKFATVHAAEGDGVMAETIRMHAHRYAIANLTAEKRDLFKNPFSEKELARYKAAVLNPPRIGARAQSEKLAASAIPTVVMISCNPASFARDAKILKAGGFTLASVEGIDQFTWSPHLEIAAVFKR